MGKIRRHEVSGELRRVDSDVVAFIGPQARDQQLALVIGDADLLVEQLDRHAGDTAGRDQGKPVIYRAGRIDPAAHDHDRPAMADIAARIVIIAIAACVGFPVAAEVGNAAVAGDVAVARVKAAVPTEAAPGRGRPLGRDAERFRPIAGLRRNAHGGALARRVGERREDRTTTPVLDVLVRGQVEGEPLAEAREPAEGGIAVALQPAIALVGIAETERSHDLRRIAHLDKIALAQGRGAVDAGKVVIAAGRSGDPRRQPKAAVRPIVSGGDQPARPAVMGAHRARHAEYAKDARQPGGADSAVDEMRGGLRMRLHRQPVGDAAPPGARGKGIALIIKGSQPVVLAQRAGLDRPFVQPLSQEQRGVVEGEAHGGGAAERIGEHELRLPEAVHAPGRPADFERPRRDAVGIAFDAVDVEIELRGNHGAAEEGDQGGGHQIRLQRIVGAELDAAHACGTRPLARHCHAIPQAHRQALVGEGHRP